MIGIRVAVFALLVAQAPAAAPPAADATARELARLRVAGFPLIDFHTHLKEGLQLETVLQRTRVDGIKAGIAINGGLSFPINSDAGLEPFLQDMKGKPVLVAFQAEGREWVRLFTRQTLERFDYVFTDSMTWTDDEGHRMRLWIDGEVPPIADAQKFMEMLVDRTVKIVSDEPIDIYVNPTYLPNQISSRYDELWTPERMTRVVTALRANGVAMEINNRYRIPSEAFIRRARAAGVKLACGTNNTGPADLGRMEYCLRIIRDLDLTPADMFTPPADGRKAIQRKPLVRAGDAP
jgi:hypothetical protein